MSDDALSEDGARAELDAAEKVADMKGVSLNTFIFPRNKVGHLPALRSKGYLGYREELPRRSGAMGQVFALASEFNLWVEPQRPLRPPPGELVRIPAGYFFNWRFGARRRVPLKVTVRRWQSLLNRAAATGGVAHLWFHPHNLITGPDTYMSLEAVLAYAAELRENGRIKVMTQQSYCRDLLKSAA